LINYNFLSWREEAYYEGDSFIMIRGLSALLKKHIQSKGGAFSRVLKHSGKEAGGCSMG